ncbi:MAG: hypothetical protein ACFFEF_10200 [Candidatus Thorarchaeota archaeon]
MKFDELRIEFLQTLSEMYKKYDYPDYCGWIEGLLLLEPDEWTLDRISKRLSEMLPASENPVLNSEISKALKTLESYSVIEKTGSEESGYQYRLVSSSSLVSAMLQRVIIVNQGFVRRMKDLAAKDLKDDTDLEQAISMYLRHGITPWRIR